MCAHCSYQSKFSHVIVLAKDNFYAGDHTEWHASSLQAVVERVHTVYYRSHFRNVTALATVTFYARNYDEWHALSLQAVVLLVHTVQYRCQFRYATMLATVTFFAGNHSKRHASSLQAVVLLENTVHIGVSSVMSPCSLESLSMIVSTLSSTRCLCKLTFECVHTVHNWSPFRHVTLIARVTLYAAKQVEWNASPLQAVVGCVHTVYYRGIFRHVNFVAAFTSKTGDALIGRCCFCKLSLDFIILFTIEVLSVISTFSLYFLSKLVTTLCGTRRLCKLSSYVCTLFFIGNISVVSL
jgi:hypothetical protein